MKRFLDTVGQFWCKNMHTEMTWPFRGHYRCRTCLREYPVPFEAPHIGTIRPAVS